MHHLPMPWQPLTSGALLCHGLSCRGLLSGVTSRSAPGARAEALLMRASSTPRAWRGLLMSSAPLQDDLSGDGQLRKRGYKGIPRLGGVRRLKSKALPEPALPVEVDHRGGKKQPRRDKRGDPQRVPTANSAEGCESGPCRREGGDYSSGDHSDRMDFLLHRAIVRREDARAKGGCGETRNPEPLVFCLRQRPRKRHPRAGPSFLPSHRC